MHRVKHVVVPCRIDLYAALLLFLCTSPPVCAQTNDMPSLLQDFSAKAALGTPRSMLDRDTVNTMDRFEAADQATMQAAFPAILRAASSPYASVREIAAMDCFLITTKPAVAMRLLLGHPDLYAALIVDPDLQVRKFIGLALVNVHTLGGLGPESPLIPRLREYLLREDAIQTPGPAYAGLLMSAAPNNPATASTIVAFMQRKDQDRASKADLLQSVRIAQYKDPSVGKAVADYAAEHDEVVSVDAIQTLRSMGPTIVRDNERLLLQLAADQQRPARVRVAAKEALAPVPPQ